LDWLRWKKEKRTKGESSPTWIIPRYCWKYQYRETAVRRDFFIFSGRSDSFWFSDLEARFSVERNGY
jgi:hypothetical protein